MKRILAFCAFGILCHCFCCAQRPDSLRAVYNSKTQADTSRLKALGKIILGYKNNNPDTVIVLANLQLKDAQQAKNKLYEGLAINSLGLAYMNKGSFDEALSYLNKALAIAKQINNKALCAMVYSNMGLVNHNKADFPKAR